MTPLPLLSLAPIILLALASQRAPSKWGEARQEQDFVYILTVQSVNETQGYEHIALWALDTLWLCPILKI